MKAARDKAGGEKDIAVYLTANENAIPFYEKLGMNKAILPESKIEIYIGGYGMNDMNEKIIDIIIKKADG